MLYNRRSLNSACYMICNLHVTYNFRDITWFGPYNIDVTYTLFTIYLKYNIYRDDILKVMLHSCKCIM